MYVMLLLRCQYQHYPVLHFFYYLPFNDDGAKQKTVCNPSVWNGSNRNAIDMPNGIEKLSI